MAKEVRYEAFNTDGGCDVLIVAYGTVARIAKTAIDMAREKGLKIGLFRPITLYPYPSDALLKTAEGAKAVLVSELSTGQMVEDVRAAIAGRRPVGFYGRVGGMVMGPDELVEQAEKLVPVHA
jgi:2-oxoglutarate ferredoxin oxidoreductase subunit alpha